MREVGGRCTEGMTRGEISAHEGCEDYVCAVLDCDNMLVSGLQTCSELSAHK
jgi:hypothetical protein